MQHTIVLNRDGHTLLHIAGIALVASRLLQTWGMWDTEVAGLGRKSGQSLTWLSIVALAIGNFWQVVLK